MERDTIDRHMTQEQRVDALRFDFQDRVGKRSVAPWTVTEVEAQEMLAGNSVSVLLPAFTDAGTEVKRLRDVKLVFLTEEETLSVVREWVSRHRRREARKNEHRQLSHREKHVTSRVPMTKEVEVVFA